VLLFVKPDLLDAIARGRKTLTIRPWKTCRLQPGGTLTFNWRIKAELTAIRRCTFADITAAEAKAAGYASRPAFRAAFVGLYPAVVDASPVVVLTFVVVTNRSSHNARA